MINHRYLNTGLFRAAALLALAMAAAFATGCAGARDADHAATARIAPEAAQYVTRFADEAQSRGREVAVTDLVVEFGQVQASPGQTVARGVCSVATGETPVVTLSREAWDTASEAEREELVFHELGHCLLGLAHEAGINAEGIPSSMMNPTEIDGAIYQQNRDFYLQGLFGN